MSDSDIQRHPDSLPLVGVDTGGTFTDFVYLNSAGELHTHKVLSTPDDPARAILTGLRELGLEQAACRLVHGTTVGTNAVLEDRGAKVAFVTNTGFADLLTLGRQNRPDIYTLSPAPQTPPVARELCIEVPVRLAADGSELSALDADKLSALVAEIKRKKPESVAICLLFAWLNPSQEQQLAQALPADLFVSCSADVLPAIGEYERAITTWLNARVGRMLQDYLHRLQQQLPRARIAVMQSSGHTIAARLAGGQAVRLLLSGPAGGLAAVASLARMAQAGVPRQLLSFDMGGTSTDVALVEQRPVLTSRGRIGRWPVAVPMVDMHTIGAGGGSIAWLDTAGGLQVGPQSAGAAPGPACYGQGGQQATVTDAHVVLGHIPASARLAGNLSLDKNAARQAFAVLASALELTIEQAAQGVLDIANEHMARALRVMSAERGHDPGALTLTSFGGAGGLHVCALARRLGMSRALVPVHGGVLSALGMLLASPGRELTKSHLQLLRSSAAADINAALDELAAAARGQLVDEGLEVEQIELRPQLDCRYQGQSHTITVDWPDQRAQAACDSISMAGEQFEILHEQQNGHRLDLPVELVNVRITATGQPRLGELPAVVPVNSHDDVTQAVHGQAQAVPVLPRNQLPTGEQALDGPAIIMDQLATVWLAPGWQAHLDHFGNLHLRHKKTA